MMRQVIWVLSFGLFAAMARADEPREFRLDAPVALQQTGLIDHLLPRFALKTGRRGQLVTTEADVVIADGRGGTPAFARGDQVWSVRRLTDSDAGGRFADWLLSDIGVNTIRSFAPLTGEGFSAVAQETVVAEVVFEGDAVHGLDVSRVHCRRCHRVAVDGTGIGIGSAPSFMALRALPDWAARFAAFYALNPHPSFMLVEGISPAFDPMHPPPIVPVKLTLDEVEAVQAYVSGLPPADLGAEVEAN
jgi:mono/diheme cytochrome c family protein